MSAEAILWGATWGNNMAALEWACGTGALLWLGREHAGRRLAAWWARHYAHAAEQHARSCQCSTTCET